MRKIDLIITLEKLEKAFKRLEEAIDKTKDDLDRDGTIQRSEFTFEQLWKTLKNTLEYLGTPCHSPRDCIKKAFKSDLVPDDEILLDMLEDRNSSSHIYDESTALEIFERIRSAYLDSIRRVVESLKKNLNLD